MTRSALLLGFLATALIHSSPGQAAYEGPWCAHRLLGGGFIENNCAMRNYEQCREYIFPGAGAWCTENPRYVPPAEPARRKARPRQPR